MADILTEVRKLQQRLRESGRNEWISKLDDAEIGGSTGTEILVRLGGCIRDLKRNTPGLEKDIMKLCNAILKQIDRALKL